MNLSAAGIILKIERMWLGTIEEAFLRNGLTKSDLNNQVDEIVYQPIFGGNFNDLETKTCMEVKYKGVVIARLTRSGYLYRAEGYIFNWETTPPNNNSNNNSESRNGQQSDY